MIRPSRTALGLLGWVVAAAAAITAGIFAVGAIGSGISGSSTSPLSNQAVAKALAQTTAGPAPTRSAVRSTAPRPSRPAPGSSAGSRAPDRSTARSSARSADRPPPRRSVPVQAGTTRVLSVQGGSIVANCTDGLATLQSWSPGQGYATDSIQRGPQAVARLTFKSSAAEVKVAVSCANGVPTAQPTSDDDHGDGGRGRGGRH